MTSAVFGVKVRAVVMYRTVSGRGLDMLGRVDHVVLGTDMEEGGGGGRGYSPWFWLHVLKHLYPFQTWHIMHILSSLNSHRMRITLPVSKGYKLQKVSYTFLSQVVKSNHYKFPKNPYYRCMLAWNSLPVDISLLDSKESFTKAVKDTVHNPYIKVL